MALVVGTEKIPRERGYLYYLGKDGRIWKTPTKLNQSGKKSPVTTERYRRIPGYLYFLNKDGLVSVARMKGAPLIRFKPDDFVLPSDEALERRMRRER